MTLDAYIGSTSFSLPPLEQMTLTAFSLLQQHQDPRLHTPDPESSHRQARRRCDLVHDLEHVFLIAHLSTIAYALVNQADAALALCFAGNALCCLAILVVAMRSKLRHLREHRLLANNFLALLPPDLPEAQEADCRSQVRPIGTTGKSVKTCPAPSRKIFRFTRNPNQRHNSEHLIHQRGVGHVTNAR